MSLLIDEDARTKFAKELGVPPGELEEHGAFISDPDLEGEYIAALGAADTWNALVASGLFTNNQLADRAKTGPAGTPTEVDLQIFIRAHKRYKVLAALAVSKALDAATAPEIKSVNDALTQIAGA